MPKLTDPWFEAQFINEIDETRSYALHGHDLNGAQGLTLWCPCGYGKAEYPHAITIPFANPVNAPAVPDNFGPVASDGHHPRWTVSGTSLADLTITPSISIGDPECWHGFITAGEVT